MNRSAQVIEFDVTRRPAFHALQQGHHSCNHTPAEIVRMVQRKLSEFSNEQLALLMITLEQQHKQRLADSVH